MTPRRTIGYALVAIAFAFVILLGLGAIEPIGDVGGGRSVGGMVAALAPSLLVPLAIFLAGVALARGGRRP